MKPCTVLVVEDNKTIATIWGSKLRREGFAVLLAHSGSQAVTVAKRDEADVALLDVMMPDMDGFEVAERLRQDPATAHIPIIFVTGLVRAGDKRRARGLGAAAYLVKSEITPQEMVEHVRRVAAADAAVLPSPPIASDPSAV